MLLSIRRFHIVMEFDPKTSKGVTLSALRTKLVGTILCPKATSTNFDMQYSTSMMYTHSITTYSSMASRLWVHTLRN